jgi:hypothetical protein
MSSDSPLNAKFGIKTSQGVPCMINSAEDELKKVVLHVYANILVYTVGKMNLSLQDHLTPLNVKA